MVNLCDILKTANEYKITRQSMGSLGRNQELCRDGRKLWGKGYLHLLNCGDGSICTLICQNSSNCTFLKCSIYLMLVLLKLICL